MRKIKIQIKEGIKYLSQIEGFELPNGICNKGVTNCGATTLALEDNHKTVICSPRIRLLENKWQQYKEKSFLVIGGVQQYQIMDYMNHTAIPKILVSYDSLPKVIACMEDKKEWRVVIDEFHFLLLDSSFKSETEFKTLEVLKDCPYVTYLSASPMLDKYLEQINQFKNMEYYQLEWTNVRKINVKRYKTPRPIDAALQIIEQYKSGQFFTLHSCNGEIQSKECVIFLNSVTNIVNIIKQASLSPEQVNIIVARTDENNKLIVQLGDGFQNGEIPLKGEKHKMITLCTSTSYAGCDFYSTNAATFVISDCKSKSMSVDIATELVQIAGRQRLECNPFRNLLFFIYRTGASDMDKEEFYNDLQKKRELTFQTINSFNGLPILVKEKQIRDTLKLQKILKYSDDYVMYDSVNQKFTFNNMAYVYEQFSYDLQQIYKDGITVKEQLKDNNFEITSDQEYIDEFENQLECTIVRESFVDRMQRYCLEKAKHTKGLNLACMILEDKYPELKFYYEKLGGKRIRALDYKESKLKNEISILSAKNKITLLLHKKLQPSMTLTTERIKIIMKECYETVGIKKPALIPDLEREYGFKIKSTKIRIDPEHRKNGYVILE